MRKALVASIAVSAVAFTAVCIPSATPVTASSCDDVKFIFARGTGEKLDDQEFLAYQGEMTSLVQSVMPDLKYSFYELGTSSHGGAQYPAVDIGFIAAISTTISSGESYKFGKSVNQGITELKSYIAEANSICHDTKFVLAGYSQGAMVMTKSLPQLNADKVLYVANFGDPKLYLPEGKGIIPNACLGKGLSSYRAFVPNCFTSKGYLGAQNPYHTTAWQGKVGLWCNDNDFICGAGIDWSEPFRTHVKYVSDGHFRSAAVIIGKKLADTFPNRLLYPKDEAKRQISNMTNRDVVFLLDTTGSMGTSIKRHLEDCAKMAKSVIKRGGRVAFWVFGDLKEVQPQRLLDFTSSYTDYASIISIGNIPTSKGLDTPESVLSALKMVLNTQHWRSGATKSIILMTDANFHSPDLDGTTITEVADKALEIDPVNIYLVNNTNVHTDDYAELLEKTGGKFYRGLPSDLDDLEPFSRPTVNFPVSEYQGRPGDTFTFSANTISDDIVKYEWDLDLDGVYETVTSEPSVSASYSIPITGYIQLKITTTDSINSTAAAKVTVSDQITPPPTIEITDISVIDNHASIKYSLANGATATITSLDNIPIGINYSDSLEIDDISAISYLTLMPASSSGIQGTAANISFHPDGRGQALFIPLAPNSGRQ
ncbi:cutinase family protein [Candidatus Saccharibacteria bacterium]|nr:cutinase family protein [Candidatus Saccharibacteria bacterium]